MDRRSFITTAAGGALATAVSPVSEAAARTKSSAGASIAGRTLEELREEHRYWLFDDFLPFMDKYVIDHELGGFMCSVDHDGTQVAPVKRGWFEGRGIWVYSFLYNKVAREQKYLDVAAKSVNFIMKHRPSGDDLWPDSYEKDGTTNGKTDVRLYGDLFTALGLQEYSKATGDAQYWDMSKEIILKVMRLYDRPDYDTTGHRVQGVWMCLINTITNVLEHRNDPELEKILDRSIDAILNYHYHPDFKLDNENLNHDFSRIPETERSAYLGHAIETFWMIMHEAVRRKDKALFETAKERFRHHVEVGYDDVYGGVFYNLVNVDEQKFILDKLLWLQGEVLVGSLCVYEHTGEPWAKELYETMWAYVLENFPLKKYGYPLWSEWGDRRVTFKPHVSRVEHFHHPRHLMLNMLALDRMIARKGKPSGIFG